MKELRRKKIFQEFQNEANVYVQNFRGSMFYTLKQDGILMLRGRNTIYGETRFKLVPTKTLLYDRLTENYHLKSIRIISGCLFLLLYHS